MKPYYDHAGITIYHADCREIIPTLPKVDLVLTDPPYGIGFAAQPTDYQRLNGMKKSDWDNIRFDSVPMVLGAAPKQIIWGGKLLPTSSQSSMALLD